MTGTGVEIEISPEWVRWIRGFDRLPVEIMREVAEPWKQAADVMFDRSQQYAHVLTGENKASGVPPEITFEALQVVATIEYTSDHAIYEERRGGSHAFLTRAFVATERLFESAMPEAWERLVASWRGI